MPGGALSRDELIAAGWPGENIQRDAAQDRLYVALSHLRRLGLRGILFARNDGYLLDPNATLAWAQSSSSSAKP